jgi:hypothetical protein
MTLEESKAALLGELFRPWEELQNVERRERRDKARWLTLSSTPRGPKASGLVEAILNDVVLPAKRLKAHVGPASLEKLRAATAALLADLLAATNRGLWATGPTKQRGFTGKHIKWTAFDAAWRSLEDAGLLVHVKGRTQPKEGFIPAKHVAPVFRVTEKLLALAEEHGVTPWNVGLHFGGDGAGEAATR